MSSQCQVVPIDGNRGSLYFNGLDGDPGGIRTHDPRIRNPVLYPAELRDQPEFDLPAEAATCKMAASEDAPVTDPLEPFIAYPDARFSASAEPHPVDANLLDIGQRLLAAAEAVRAYGLAAVHIGVVAPVVVISVCDPDARDYRVLYNPRVLSLGAKQANGPEGSVSMPGIEVEIARAVSAEIGFDDEAGQGHTLNLSGFPARVAQHEIDQVNGVFFLSKLSRLKREAAIRRFGKLSKR